MIQKRHNIFETNSSTTHSLTITTTNMTPEFIESFKKEYGDHIVFGKNSYEDVRNMMHVDPVIDETTAFQIKADILYFSMYVWNENCRCVAEFLYHKKLLTEKLEEMGFTVEFKEDIKVIQDYEWYHYDIDVNLFEELWHDQNVDEVIDFLFNPHTLYWTWCDECVRDCPKNIVEAENRFCEYKETEEQKNYSYR